MSVARRLYGLRKNGSESDRTSVNDKLHSSLFNDSPKDYVVSSSPKIFSAIHPDDITDNFYISDKELEAYAQGFLDVATQENIQELLLDKEVEDEGLSNVALDDSDIKLSLYRSFKSLYDKWIANSGESTDSKRGYFFNNYGTNLDGRTLYDHFNFVNRGASDIGGEAVLDIAVLSELTSSSGGKGPTESLYQLTTNLLSKNNFDFFPLPSYIQYKDETDNDELAGMFKAYPDRINEFTPRPSFLCIYIGGNSRTLDIPRSSCGENNKINFEYKNDSFNIEETTENPQDITDGKGVTAFKVRYGQEAQNHFTKIELDQTEFKETQESLLVIDALASPKKGNSPSQSGKGNNIYDMYLTRGYSCKVSALGNLQIQPLMYFQLENVPMFRGTYLITNVSHKITPQKVETEFKGTRQPIVTTPLVVDPISLLDLALSESSVEGQRGSLGKFSYTDSTSTVWGGGLGETIDLNFSTPPTPDKIVGDNSEKLCPADDPFIEDAGTTIAYIKGEAYKIRLCKVKDTLGGSGKVNVDMALNLANMMRKAKAEGIDLTIGSSFRTMEGQTKTAQGNGCFATGSYVRANCKVATARPGYSNHQSGTAIDFGCNKKTICYPNSSEWCSKNGSTYLRDGVNTFPCFKFMVENANNFGYYNYPKEAWHWSATGG